MRMWFLRPVINLTAIRDRHATVALLLADPEVAGEMKAVLKQVHGARAWLCVGGVVPPWAVA
jgi:DNA mismatch repair ATPase MutS